MSAILVVDDETDLVATYERLLRRSGYHVIAAETRQAALDAIGTDRLRLIVCDLNLPDGSGLDVVRAARAAAPSPPVIVVTGFPSPAVQREALDAGAAAFLAKPFSVPSLMALVERLAGPASPRAIDA
jgi:two-component system response regulator PilR (NtrC family)